MNENESEYLQHFGILGMHWGHRKAQSAASVARTKKHLAKKKAKELIKAQKKWDDDVKVNWYKAYNKAADYSNEYIIPTINKKYEKYDFSKVDNDPKIKKVFDKYNKEYEDLFNETYEKEFGKMFGKRPK
jgi:hypothetical protein